LVNLARLEVLCSEGRNLALLPHCAIQAYPYRAGERAESTACTLRSKAMRPVSQTVDDSRANARSRCRSRSAIFGGRTRIPFTMEPYGKLQTPVTPEPLNRSRSNFHTMFTPKGTDKYRNLEPITLKGIGDSKKPQIIFSKFQSPGCPNRAASDRRVKTCCGYRCSRRACRIWLP
jgi:hypothetical protein